MDIANVSIENFLSIQKQQVFSLKDRGLVLVQGKNLVDGSANSNGAGKSTILDSISWCLFGITARGESTDSVVNRHVKKDTKVQIALEDGDNTFVVTRYRKHQKFKNKLVLETVVNGEPKDISKGTDKETQELLESILGCTHDVFVGAIYAGQESAKDLPSMTDKQLKELIERSSGIEQLEKSYELARKKYNSLVDARKAVEIEKNNVDYAITVHSNQLNIHYENAKSFEETKQKDLIEARNNVSESVSKEKELEDVCKKLSLELHKQREKVDALESKHTFSKEISEQINTFSKEKERVFAERIGFEANLRSLKEGASSRASAYKNAEIELSKPCKECGRPHQPNEIEKFKETLKERIFEIKEQAEKAKAEIEERLSKEQTLEERIQTLKKELPDESELINERKLFLECERKFNQADLALQKERSRRETLEVAVGGIELKENVHEALISQEKEKLEELEKSKSDIQGRLKVLDKDIEVAESVAKVLSPQGVRAYILDTVTPFLNERTEEYLNILSDGNLKAVWSTLGETAKGELREKFNISVNNQTGGDSFSLISGGEKRKVRIATMLALQDLVASRASKPINIFFGDEIDDALDKSGLERLMTILESKGREKGTVLVVSHNDLADWCPNILTVTKTEKGSLISEH